MEITLAEQGKKVLSKDNLRGLWEKFKHAKIFIIGAGKGRENGAENLFEEIIAENTSNLGKGTDIQVAKHKQAQKDEYNNVYTKIHCN